MRLVQIQVFDGKKYIVFLYLKITIHFCVLSEKLGSVREFTIGEHCEVNKLSERLAFVVKSPTTKSFTINNGLLGAFLLPKKY